MNREDLDNWAKATENHIEMVQNVVADRRKLKELLENHLKEFFPNWDEIEYSKDLSEVELFFDGDVTIKSNISDLGMKWIIKRYYEGVAIMVYPMKRGD